MFLGYESTVRNTKKEEINMGFADELRGTKSNEKEYIQAFADLFYNS